ncbi:MAG: hypothetical protein AAFN77_09485 [Planctomycetota bacterium]
MKWLLDGDTLILSQVAATWFLVGLIWIVQIVHYPLMANVGASDYAKYQELHEQRITWVVGPTMLIEIIGAVLLLLTPKISTTQSVLVWSGFALVILIWLATAFVSVPCHAKLANGFDSVAHSRLVITNWIRTIAWSARGVIVLMLLRLHYGILSS